MPFLTSKGNPPPLNNGTEYWERHTDPFHASAIMPALQQAGMTAANPEVMNHGPLPKAADAGLLKPLEWTRVAVLDHRYEAGNYVVRQVTVGRDKAWQWSPAAISIWDTWNPCDSLEDCKERCERHYRERMFGENGPLVYIGGGN